MIPRHRKSASSFTAGSKRRKSNSGHAAPKISQSAQRRYERYLGLARAEAQAGNVVEAENYYQHAEHYYRLMYSDAAAR
jgi:hypothetical protein